MKYIIKWKMSGYGIGRSIGNVVTGISEYSSEQQAQRQVDRWKLHFPFNNYFIEVLK